MAETKAEFAFMNEGRHLGLIVLMRTEMIEPLRMRTRYRVFDPTMDQDMDDLDEWQLFKPPDEPFTPEEHAFINAVED